MLPVHYQVMLRFIFEVHNSLLSWKLIVSLVRRDCYLLHKKKRLILLGFALVILLIVSYFENVVFFQALNTLFQGLHVAFFMVFIHNVTVISLILLAMTFYVNLVIQGFFKGQRYEYVILEHPRIFAIVFTIMIVFLSILRGSTLIFGEINVEALHKIVIVSAPIGILEGYGIYFTIKKTLSRAVSMKDLAYIYGIFFVAAVIEVSFIKLLMI